MKLATKILTMLRESFGDKPDPNKNYRLWKVSTGTETFHARTSLGKTKVEALSLFKRKFPQVFNVRHIGDAVDGVYTAVASNESNGNTEPVSKYTIFDGDILRKIG